MGSKLQRNAILTAYINSYCLVCECSFDSSEDTRAHIQEDAHAENLLKHPYLEKYGVNHIRKVNKGYFCEFCGLLLATATKVSLHIQDKAHFENKGTFLLRRPSGLSGVIAFDDILISERAWHSLTEDTCAICNEEFSNENIHKTESSHLLRLVQNKVQFGSGNNIYRKTDDTSFQCLTCNSVFVLSTLDNHFNDAEHKKLYAKCQEDMKKYTEQNRATKEVEGTNKTDAKKHENLSKKVDKNHNEISVKHQNQNLCDSKPDLKKDENNSNKVENDSKKFENDSKTVDKNHNEIAEKPQKQVSCDIKELDMKGGSVKTEDEVRVYADANNLTYNAGNSNAFCRICETKLPATLRSMKEHVNGKEHKSRMARAAQAAQAAQAAKAKPTMTKRPTLKFLKSDVIVENLFHHDIILNDKYCIPLNSFVLATKIGAKFRCQCCEVNIYDDDIQEHSNSARHLRAAENTYIITSLPDSEFVREVRTGIFHCGFCNLIIPRWEEVDSHLSSREHKETKDACNWRLQRYMPGIQQHRLEQEMNLLGLLAMRHGGFRR